MSKTYTSRTAISHTDIYIEPGRRGLTEKDLAGLPIPYLVSRRALIPEGRLSKPIDVKTATRDELVAYIKAQREAEAEAKQAAKLSKRDELPEVALFPLDTGETHTRHPKSSTPLQRGSKAPDYHPGIDDDDKDADDSDTDTPIVPHTPDVAALVKVEVSAMESRLLEAMAGLMAKRD